MPAIWSPTFLINWDALSGTDPVAPGPQLSELFDDGVWTADVAEHKTLTFANPARDPCVSECPGPRYVMRVKPGERYWYLMTVRNDGPLPVVLEGTEAEPAYVGLARLVDPAKLSADPSNLRAWEPVPLNPGQSVTIARVEVGETCANPAAAAGPNPGYSTYVELVYSVLGWRRTGDASRHATVVVAGCTR
jgi:hypothetical protein